MPVITIWLVCVFGLDLDPAYQHLSPSSAIFIFKGALTRPLVDLLDGVSFVYNFLFASPGPKTPSLLLAISSITN